MIKLAFCKYMMRCLSFLNLKQLHALGQVIGDLAFRYCKKERCIIEDNLSYVDCPETDNLVQPCFQELGKSIVEQSAFWYWSIDRLGGLVHSVEQQHLFDEAVIAGRGVIIAMPHFGAWELINHWVCQRTAMTAMYRPPRDSSIDVLLRSVRQRHGAKLAPTNAGGVKKIIRAIKDGETICLLPDQEPEITSGNYAPFFGKPALTMNLLHRILRRNPVPVLFVGVERLADAQGYRIHFHEAETALYDACPKVASCSLNRSLEGLISLAPAQYAWNYKRFRRGPTVAAPPSYQRHKL